MAAIELAVVRVWPKSTIASCTAAVGHGYRRNQAFLILGRPRPLPLQHNARVNRVKAKDVVPGQCQLIQNMEITTEQAAAPR